MRAAVFDLDGTLADTVGGPDRGGERSACRGRASARRSIRSRDRATAFAGGRAMLRAGLGAAAADEAAVERLYPRLLELYGAALAVQTRLYDGVEAALDRLAARGLDARGLHQQARGGWRRCCSTALGIGGAVRRGARRRQPAPGASPTRGT